MKNKSKLIFSLVSLFLVVGIFGVVSAEENTSCIDSDGGINYAIKGDVTTYLNGGVQVSIDFCENSDTLNESYCEGNISNTLTRDCGMENKVCLNGACVSEIVCVDSDGGNNLYVSGNCSDNRGFKMSDGCIGGKEGWMKEAYCTSNSKCTIDEYYCPEGCLNGACLGVNPNVNLTNENNSLNENISTKEITSCSFEEKNYPFGYRKGENYCDLDGTFISQKESESVCENNFECISNLCTSERCVDAGLFQKIISWFKNLF